MKTITRSQFIDHLVTKFENSENPSLTIDLYGSEIRRLERKNPHLEVLKGPHSFASYTDQRYRCVITKRIR